MIKSSLTGFGNLTTSLLHAVVNVVTEDWLSKVLSQEGNQIQHMKLQHCSYITQSKVQHFLKNVIHVVIKFAEYAGINREWSACLNLIPVF